MAVERLKKRKEVEKKYKWTLDDIYPSIKKWEEDFNLAREHLPILSDFSGKLPNDPSLLSSILMEYSRLAKRVEKLFVYAHLKRDEDNTNQEAQALMDRARSLVVETESACSFMIPDILKIDPRKLEKLLREDRKLSDYGHYIALYDSLH